MLLNITLYLFLTLFQSQSNVTKVDFNHVVLQDTLSSVALRNRIYGNDNYTVLLIKDLGTDTGVLNSRKKISVTQNNNIIGSILLPIADAAAKNFSVSNISETKEGFKIACNWGVGNYLYDIEYYFTYKNTQFYFSELRSSMYGPNKKEKKLTKLIRPFIPINKFDITAYLNNH